MDRIIRIAVTFSDGKKEMTRTYTVVPETAFIKSENPQAKHLGYVEVKGKVTGYKDEP